MALETKISIIIPIYNVELYIEKCLTSVMSQTYKGKVECILVNDCSQDNSIVIAKQLINNYKGNIIFRIIERYINGGLSAARNTGVHAAGGDYIYFLDSDDWIYPKCIELLINVAYQYPLAEIVQAGAKTNVPDYKYLSLRQNKLPIYNENRCNIKKYMLDSIYPPTAWNKLINRQWLLKYKLYFKEGLLHEDDHWNFFAAKYVSRYAITKQDTYFYNIREGSITQSPNEKNIQSRLFIIGDFLANIDDSCKQKQRSLIFKMAYTNYAKFETYRMSFSEKLSQLSAQSTFLGRIIIKAVIHLPYFFNKQHFLRKVIERIFSKIV